jgi:LAS superfamily LD-carboxypeptidase LdcB
LAANQTLKGIAQPHAEVPEGSSSVTAESAKLVGQADTHLCSPTEVERLGVPVHEDVVEPFMELRAAAATEGFDVAIHSGFRSFDRQLSIWNRKADGQLAVLDSSARPIDITTLSERELVFAILRWSALPGASRHHWGTDLDVFDAGGMPDGYQVELIPSEYERGGYFAAFSNWLDGRIANHSAFGFFRPYDRDRNGVAPERWHLSYAPLASRYVRMMSPDLLRTAIEGADMRLKDVVLANLDVLFARFVVNTNPDVP